VNVTTGALIFTGSAATRSSNASPTIADDMLFMGSNDHNLYAYK
jgi:hypothetical protein